MFLSNNDVFTFASDEAWAKADSLFVSSLLSDEKVKNSAVDSWGNVKIPMLETLKTLSDAEGWHSLAGSGATTYSSLIGVPIAGMPTSGNTSSFIQTSYWTLDCSSVRQPLDGFLGANTSNYEWQGFRIDSFSPRAEIWQTDKTMNASALPRRLIYNGTFINSEGIRQFDHALCDIKTTYVEVEVRCSAAMCEAKSMRKSTLPQVVSLSDQLGDLDDRTFDRELHFPAIWTSFDALTPFQYWAFIFPSFMDHMNSLASSTNIIIGGTAIQHYFLDHGNPFTFDVKNMKSITSLPPGSFATSFAQILNTYWLAVIGRNVVPMNRIGSLSNLSSDYDMKNILETVGKRTQTDVFVCHRGWLVVLIIASIAILLSGITSIVLSTITIGPELAMNISTVLREAKHADLPGGGTTLDDDERGRLLKDVKVRMGDVRPRRGVGRIGIGTYEDVTQEPAKLRKKRLYE